MTFSRYFFPALSVFLVAFSHQLFMMLVLLLMVFPEQDSPVLRFFMMFHRLFFSMMLPRLVVFSGNLFLAMLLSPHMLVMFFPVVFMVAVTMVF